MKEPFISTTAIAFLVAVLSAAVWIIWSIWGDCPDFVPKICGTSSVITILAYLGYEIYEK